MKSFFGVSRKKTNKAPTWQQWYETVTRDARCQSEQQQLERVMGRTAAFDFLMMMFNTVITKLQEVQGIATQNQCHQTDPQIWDKDECRIPANQADTA